jgi:hypothetical protein
MLKNKSTASTAPVIQTNARDRTTPLPLDLGAAGDDGAGACGDGDGAGDGAAGGDGSGDCADDGGDCAGAAAGGAGALEVDGLSLMDSYLDFLAAAPAMNNSTTRSAVFRFTRKPGISIGALI